jgi:hypothetical protein
MFELSHAQSCNPAAVHYIVRDEKGVVLTKEQLQSLQEQLPKLIGDADVAVDDVSFAADKQTFYWPEDVESQKGTKVPVLMFVNASTCTLHLTEVSLNYRGKVMRLLFNVDIARHQPDRRPVVDSLRFQTGSFKLDLTGWSHAPEKMISAKHWKKVKG